MKHKDEKILRGLIAREIKELPNKTFTAETMSKLDLFRSKKLSSPFFFDSIFSLPILFYSLAVGLYYIIKFLSIVTILDLSNKFIETIILSPIVISSIISFTVLSLLDFYLKKEIIVKRTKSNKRYGRIPQTAI